MTGNMGRAHVHGRGMLLVAAALARYAFASNVVPAPGGPVALLHLESIDSAPMAYESFTAFVEALERAGRI